MSTPTERVAEFLRQWARGRDKSDVIYGVHFDVDADMADLTASDIASLLAELKKKNTQLKAATRVLLRLESECTHHLTRVERNQIVGFPDDWTPLSERHPEYFGGTK